MAETPSPARFVQLMAPAVLEAARVARALEGRVANRPKLGEGSAAKAALTRADGASQEAILDALLKHFPGVGLEAEEDTARVSRFAGGGPARVVIDPIDGTLHSYLQGRGPYGIMVGLCIDDRFEAALVALPREGLLFDATRGGAAHERSGEDAPRAAAAAADGRRVLVSYQMPESVLARLRDDGYEPVFGCGGAISVAPLVLGVCGGLRLAEIAQGISIRGRIGLTIARAAGCRALSESGQPFPEQVGQGATGLVVAADEADLERLLGALRSA